MTAFSGWAIDRDYINGGPESYDVPKRVGYGQTEAELETDGEADRLLVKSVTIRQGLKARDVIEPVRFRVLDDDGEVYYGGAISRSWLDGEEDQCFGPLEFAAADAGATELQINHGPAFFRSDVDGSSKCLTKTDWVTI
jgi:hypothetical protein